MQVVAGLSLKNLKPRVWDAASPWYLPSLRAVMLSYADLCSKPSHRRRAVEDGLHGLLGIPQHIEIYLDNGAFFFSARQMETDTAEYQAFVAGARPDWKPVSQDFIPTPQMTLVEQRECLRRTMQVNRQFLQDGYVPVIHISQVLEEYIDAVTSDPGLSEKTAIALGAIVPNLLRAPKAMAYSRVLDSLRLVRKEFAAKDLHVFGIGGTATLHLAALLGMDSVDSSGWRNRAARGIVQLPGSGDRMIANLGSWRGRKPDEHELEVLAQCPCPACRLHGLDGLRTTGQTGFCHRAAHNLWVLLEEAQWIDARLQAGIYWREFPKRLDNSIYLPIIQKAAALVEQTGLGHRG